MPGRHAPFPSDRQSQQRCEKIIPRQETSLGSYLQVGEDCLVINPVTKGLAGQIAREFIAD